MTQRYKHLCFHALRVGENFHYGKFLYHKTSYFLGRAHLDGNAVVIFPWTRVRSTRPYGKPSPRPPVPVTPGGDRRSETIGGKEWTPSA